MEFYFMNIFRLDFKISLIVEIIILDYKFKYKKKRKCEVMSFLLFPFFSIFYFIKEDVNIPCIDEYLRVF